MMQPKIRLKGFSGEWVDHKLSEKEFHIIAGGDIDKEILVKEGKYPVIANALTNDGFLGFYENSYRVEGPAVTVTGRGDVGIAVARHYSFTPVVRLLAIKSEHNVDFLANAINCCKVAKESTGVPQLTTSKLQEYCIFTPNNIEEEKHIASYFTSLDSQISATSSRLESLKKVKTASLQAMFPQEGESVPRIRFKGFEGEWKKTTFNETVIINSGRDYKHLTEGDIPVYGTGGYMLSVNKSLSEMDAIGIGRKGTIDKPFLLKAPFWTVDTLFFMTPKNDCDLNFLFAVCEKTNWRKYDESTGVPSLSKLNIGNIEFNIPTKDEQQKIADYFTNLDKQINLQSQRLEKLKQIKAACLDLMFV